MLLECPECSQQISTKAFSCPHCGYPLRSNATVRRFKTPSKRMRLPNGFGQISELKRQHLRNPYRAMVTVKKDSVGKPVQKIVGYYDSYNSAYAALLEYHKSPYSLDNNLTVSQLYTAWSEQYFKTLNAYSSVHSYTTAWAYCTSVYNLKVTELRIKHIKHCINEGEFTYAGKVRRPSINTQKNIKKLFNKLMDYAVEYEIVDKNYARTFSVSKEPHGQSKVEKSHLSFSNEEMNILWEHVYNERYCDIIVIQCYTGLRPQELGLIKLKNVNLDENYIIGGMKTESGTDRYIPIHPLIKELVENKYKEAKLIGSEYLINCTENISDKSATKMTYSKYRLRFNKVIKTLELNEKHRPHDPRKQFITMAKRSDMDEYAIKYIVGHTITDITENIYTDRDNKWLKDEIKKIK